MVKDMIKRLKESIKDSSIAGPKHAVVISQVDAKRLLYRLIMEEKSCGTYTNGVTGKL